MGLFIVLGNIYYATIINTIIFGFNAGMLDVGNNTLLIRLWRNKVEAPMQATHFFFRWRCIFISTNLWYINELN